MHQDPPHGTNIEIVMFEGHERIIVPHQKCRIAILLTIPLFLCWLFVWYMGFTDAVARIRAGNGGLFLRFWLAGWMIVGSLSLMAAYRALRFPIPEQLTLNKPNFSFDSGIPRLEMGFTKSDLRELWKSIFYTRKKYEFTREEFDTLKLREADTTNRLTIDSGAGRIELAKSATEIEREWLFRYLQAFYS